MTNSVLHKANTRGHANHGWLNAHHSFSFANYYNPERMHFGVLRVLNDDIVAAGMGFGTHPHDNMEIVTIPLQGDLEHKDSMGNNEIIRAGDVQAMSAGTGIRHSEFNPNADREVRLLQIWLFPRERSVTPRYDQISYDQAKMQNNFLQIVSPNPEDDGVWIHQDAWFHLGNFDAGIETSYTVQRPNKNGVYAFIIGGDVVVNGQQLSSRDALGVWDTTVLDIKAVSNAQILLIEVPMDVS